MVLLRLSIELCPELCAESHCMEFFFLYHFSVLSVAFLQKRTLLETTQNNNSLICWLLCAYTQAIRGQVSA